VQHRSELVPLLSQALQQRSRNHWILALEAVGVPCGPVNTLSQVFADPHVQAREMVVRMPHAGAATGSVDVVANPIRLSETPVQYRTAPPMRNEHEGEILRDWLGDSV
jgi:crotonobetainyl-CoA:carnitine CoA-transferase CaiB-like acyl-CoA transferase